MILKLSMNIIGQRRKMAGMKHTLQLIALVSVFFFSLLHSNIEADEVATALDGIKSPPYHEGQFWRFRLTERGGDPLDYNTSRLSQGVYEIIFSGNQLKAFYIAPDQTMEEVDVGNPSFAQWLGMDNDFQFPLSINANWTYRYTRRISRPAPATPAFRCIAHTVSINVSGVQDVKTQAGSFRAFRLVKEDKFDTSSRRIPTTILYSDQTRSVVRLAGGGRRQSVELIAYGIVSGSTPLVLKSVENPE
jgi:hypothetical protein